LPAPQATKVLPPGLTVFEPLKTVLNVGGGEALHVSVMNAFALPPVLSFLIENWVPVGVTVIAVVEHRLMVVPVVRSQTGGGTAQVAGHEAMHRPMAPGSPKDRQLFSQSLIQSAKARLAVVMTASPAIDAMNRFMFSFLVVLESMGSIDKGS
jgi:hypothetical protein